MTIEAAYYLAWSTQSVAFTELVAVAGRRWVTGEMFQITKDLDCGQLRVQVGTRAQHHTSPNRSR